MKLLTVLVCLLAATATAAPGIWGTRGLWRVHDARCEGGYQASAALRYFYHTTAFANADEPLRRGYRPDMTVYTNDVVGAVAVSPSKYFELFCWYGGIREYSSRHPDSPVVENAWLMGYENWWDWHNAVPGAKLSLAVNDAVTVGVLAGYGSGYDPKYWRWGKFGFGTVNGLVLGVLGNYVVRDILPNPGTVSVNIVKLGSQTTSFAAAGVYAINRFDVFAEVVYELWSTDSAYYWAGDRIYLTPGVKLNHLQPVTFDPGLLRAESCNPGIRALCRGQHHRRGLQAGDTDNRQDSRPRDRPAHRRAGRCRRRLSAASEPAGPANRRPRGRIQPHRRRAGRGPGRGQRARLRHEIPAPLGQGRQDHPGRAAA